MNFEWQENCNERTLPNPAYGWKLEKFDIGILIEYDVKCDEKSNGGIYFVKLFIVFTLEGVKVPKM